MRQSVKVRYKPLGFRVHLRHIKLDSTSPLSSMNISDAKDVLRRQMRLAGIASQITSVLGPDTRPRSVHQSSRRKYAKRSLGAGAFMKGETLRAIDGRILRHGQIDCFTFRKRIVHETFSSPNAKSFVSDAIHESRYQRQRQHTRQGSFSPPKTPPPVTDHTPFLSPSGSSDSNSVSSNDELHHTEWEECSPEWYRAHWARTMQDIQEADDMFRQFIDADQCDDTMCIGWTGVAGIHT
ncbi:hypothetical protein D9615_001448 [Tricholomella constricta]|uniref:Uncharacterized protein n=1 Tax=Tricholomella constricta TaxID=117010 RepID=A0A8H5M8P9_9AGAR|nr:hypothetical protein D9615_001448 [Tricholomella constricta]